MNLYTTHAKSFSDTRQAAWPGWKKLHKYLKELGELSIVDLGCGNGRFLKFLTLSKFGDRAYRQAGGEGEVGKLNKSKSKIKNYLGIDNSEPLLEIARKEFSDEKYKFINTDLESLSFQLNMHLIREQLRTTNLVVAFGLMHHLHSYEKRLELLKNSALFIQKKGYIVVTFWQFLKIKNIKTKIVKMHSKEFDDENFQKHDFVLSFGQDKDALRFCHYCDDEEIDRLVKESELKKVDDFYSDGKSGDLNRYIVFKLND